MAGRKPGITCLYFYPEGEILVLLVLGHTIKGEKYEMNAAAW